MRLRLIGANLFAAVRGPSSERSGASRARGGFAGAEGDLGQLRVGG
jgi:hypothetical protein